MIKLANFKTLRLHWQAHKPLGWAQLYHQKIRLLVAVTGVAFSNILIFTQLGLRALLFDGITLVPESLQGDLFLVSAYAPTISSGSFPRVHLYQADAVAGVAAASPLYISSENWVNPLDLESEEEVDTAPPRSVRLFPNTVKILAFNPVQPVLNLPEVNQQLDRLHAPGGVLYDRLAQDKLGPVTELYDQQGVVTTVMNNRRVYVVGLFSLGSTIFDNGHVIMSDWNYARRNGQDSLNRVSVGALTLEPGADLEQVRTRLRDRLSRDVQILTREEIMEAEQAFRASFPNGKILNFGAMMGFVVGIIVVYQVLYTDVSDHLPEYATLKAMGYSDRALLLVVLQEALILAVTGFVPGLLASQGVYVLLTQITRIPLTMRAGVILQVFVLTLVMCAISGAIAVNKLRAADPADVFKN
ncbi:MAG: ABC transporter permease DevC [Synechococcales bacterium]|nr:ABC transporter permease DevC [Synechococcales bacterium]